MEDMHKTTIKDVDEVKEVCHDRGKWQTIVFAYCSGI